MGEDLSGISDQSRVPLLSGFTDGPESTTGASPPLQGISGQAPVEGRPRLGEDPRSTPNPGGLGEIASVFGGLTQKAEPIRQALGDGLAERLEAQVSRMSPQDQARVQSLLHFAWYATIGTTPETRQQIRTVLASFIAGGGNLEQALELKSMLKSGTAPDALDRLYRLRGAPDELIRCAPLQCLSGKGEAIMSHLHRDIGDRLSQRLRDMAPGDRQGVRNLLHISWFAQGDTTPESRLMIRTVLAAFIANSGTLGGGDHFKTLLMQLPADKLEALYNRVHGSDDYFPKVLSDQLLDTGLKPDEAAAAFKALRPVLEGFLRDPARANRTEFFFWGDPAFRRDAHGDLKVANIEAKFMSFPRPFQQLTSRQIADIKNDFLAVAETKFSRMGPALDFMRQFRTQPQANPRLTIPEAFTGYRPVGADITGTYQRGNCYTLADRLRLSLQQQGIRTIIVGNFNGDRVPSQIGNHTLSLEQQAELTREIGGINHVDVLIPYVDDNGDDRILRLVPGEGPFESKIVDTNLFDFQMPEVTGNSRCRVQVEPGSGELVSVDISSQLKHTMSLSTKLQLRKDPFTGEEQSCGIDLIGGTFYLNGKASRAYRGGRLDGDQGVAVTFNYRAALANPTRTVTVNIPDGQGGVAPREMSNLAALRLFLTTVAREFELPDIEAFVEDMLTLMQNEDGYKETVFSETIKTVLRANSGGRGGAGGASAGLGPGEGPNGAAGGGGNG